MTLTKIPRWFVVALVVTVVVVLVVPTVRSTMGALALQVIRPISRATSWVADRLPFGASSRQVSEERQRLQQQIDDLRQRLFESEQQLETYASVAALRDYQRATAQPMQFANVIASSPDPGIQSIVIDRGSTHGVQAGEVLVNQRGAVVGKIVNAHQQFSTALLLTDRQAKISARVQNEGQSPGVIRGERGLSLLMEFIPKNDSLSNGQTVVTTGTDHLIPPNLLIGTITSVARKSGELFQQATILPAASLNRLRVVGVLTPTSS